jgi:hypothetical protein
VNWRPLKQLPRPIPMPTRSFPTQSYGKSASSKVCNRTVGVAERRLRIKQPLAEQQLAPADNPQSQCALGPRLRSPRPGDGLLCPWAKRRFGCSSRRGGRASRPGEIRKLARLIGNDTGHWSWNAMLDRNAVGHTSAGTARARMNCSTRILVSAREEGRARGRGRGISFARRAGQLCVSALCAFGSRFAPKLAPFL